MLPGLSESVNCNQFQLMIMVISLSFLFHVKESPFILIWFCPWDEILRCLKCLFFHSSPIVLLILLIKEQFLIPWFACRIFTVLLYCHIQLPVTQSLKRAFVSYPASLFSFSYLCSLTKKLKPFGDLRKLQSLIIIKA